ncbi:MAG: DUF72 domain-containing protein [Nitrospirae bacterium]|nr:DUF72 domain-containing protein [Nitrospirota bacterium]MBU6482491.1 DUF72 domain-containing protein [Nitrospirota bacterium]MDE3218628.1 DUF72 domain-containing protein [Nitrospirota bacterium]
MSTDLSHVRFGTSSWAYEGWQGLVYRRTYPKSRFSQDTLAEYAGYAVDGAPLFSTVGIDHSFYRPASASQLAHYAEQVPDHFRFCSKVWEEITIPAYANLPRYGAKAGKPNPRFLDAGAFRELVLAPAQEGLRTKLGPFIFEFQRWGIEPATFLDALDRFLDTLPPGPQYATEVRNPAILGSRYLDILRTHQVSHVYNHWTAMPPLSDQHRLLEQTFTAPLVVIRLLTPLGLAYEKAVERYAPYDRIIAAQPRMRQDTTALVQQVVAQGKSAYVLVNNRAEGCSPLTIQALVAGLKS